MNTKYKAQKKYDQANTIGVYLKLNRTTDAEIIAFLNAADSKQGVIKALIRKEIQAQDEKKIGE